MAEAIGIAIIGSAGPTILGTSAATIVGSVVLTGALVGLSYATQSLTAQKPKRERQQATLNEAMGPRRFIYGKAMVGGTRAFWDARNGMMFQCLMLAAHEIDGIAEYWVGDVKVDTDGGEAGGNVQTYPMINAIFFERYFGTADQAAPLLLTSYFPEVWTAEHRLRGIAHVCVGFKGVKEKIRQQVFPQGAYTVLRFVVRGKKIYDPTTGMDPENPATWLWGDNSSDVILDYLRSADGYRRSLAQIDLPSFTDFHARCAENVPRKDGSPVGRYRTWGTISFDEEPQAALARLCASCDATLYQGPNGQIGIRDGAWTGPLINISTQHITGAALTQGNDKLDSYNRLKVSYTDPNNYWQPTELVARDDLSSQAAIGVIEETRDLVMVPEFTQAARLQKIMMARENPIWKGSLATDLMPLDTLGERAVDITFDPLGDAENPLMNAPCALSGFTLRGDLSGCDLAFNSVPASAWDWNASTEEPPRPITPQVIAAVNDVPAPASLTAGVSSRVLSGIGTTVTVWQWDPDSNTNVEVEVPVSAGVPANFLSASWPAAPRPDLIFELEYSVAGSGDWKPAPLADGALSTEIGPVARSTSYDLRIRHRSGGGAVSDWTYSATVVIP